MGDRNEYMKLYMRERRAAKRAAALASERGEFTEGAGLADEESEFTDDEDQLAEIPTEPGNTGGGKLIFWLVIGGLAVLFIASMVITARRNSQESYQDLTENQGDTTEPVNTDDKQENTEDPGQK